MTNDQHTRQAVDLARQANRLALIHHRLGFAAMANQWRTIRRGHMIAARQLRADK